VRSGGERAVFMGVWVLPNANSLDVITRVRKEMDTIRKTCPGDWKAASP
jgi:multidrug efflux pump